MLQIIIIKFEPNIAFWIQEMWVSDFAGLSTPLCQETPLITSLYVLHYIIVYI